MSNLRRQRLKEYCIVNLFLYTRRQCGFISPQSGISQPFLLMTQIHIQNDEETSQVKVEEGKLTVNLMYGVIDWNLNEI